MNAIRTMMLLAALTAIFMGVGFLIGGSGGVVIAFVVAAGMNLFSYWNADKLVLSMNRAREVDERSAPEFYGLVRDLAGTRRPADAARLRRRQPAAERLCHRPQPGACRGLRHHRPAPDALARGDRRRHGPRARPREEPRHADHDDHRDASPAPSPCSPISPSSSAAAATTTIRSASSACWSPRIVAPLAAMLVQMAISRTREYSADRAGAEISGRPQALASALAKISQRRRGASPTSPPSATRRRRISSSSIRSPARAWTTCSRPIRRPRTASPR